MTSSAGGTSKDYDIFSVFRKKDTTCFQSFQSAYFRAKIMKKALQQPNLVNKRAKTLIEVLKPPLDGVNRLRQAFFTLALDSVGLCVTTSEHRRAIRNNPHG